MEVIDIPSVTRRIAQIRQPYGGLLKPSKFKKTVFDDGIVLSEYTNISHALIGLAVDYLTRFMLGDSKESAFRISMAGAEICGEKELRAAKRLLKCVTGLDDQSIVNTCKLVSFDIWKRNYFGALEAITYKDVKPNASTISNIRTMVNRSLQFWEENGPIIYSGFTFELDGYSSTVSSGDGDYLTADTLWDCKVSKKNLSSQNTLQLLMYWIMGVHSKQPKYQNVQKLGVFNPKLNAAYVINTSEIPQRTVEIVEKYVICYGIPEDALSTEIVDLSNFIV